MRGEAVLNKKESEKFRGRAVVCGGKAVDDGVFLYCPWWFAQVEAALRGEGPSACPLGRRLALTPDCFLPQQQVKP